MFNSIVSTLTLTTSQDLTRRLFHCLTLIRALSARRRRRLQSGGDGRDAVVVGRSTWVVQSSRVCRSRAATPQHRLVMFDLMKIIYSIRSVHENRFFFDEIQYCVVSRVKWAWAEGNARSLKHNNASRRRKYSKIQHNRFKCFF